jgi:hypothetical protein
MFEYKLEHILSYHATLGVPEMIGPVSDGLRVNFYFTGGEVTGPKVTGKVRPAGGDWVRIRRDGIVLLDVKGMFETQDGALIHVILDGTADFGEGGYEKILAGNPPPSPTPLRTFPRFHTAHPQYAWINRLHCLGVGEARFDQSRVSYDVYAVR